MNYKEKYKAALERAKKLYKEAKANDYTSDIEDYEYIFPELKESENERIVQILIEGVEMVLQDQFCSNRGVPKEKVLAYLEKQKDITPIVVSNKDWDCQRAYSEGYQKGMAESNKQKPTEWGDEDDALLKEIVSFFKDGTVKLQHDLDLYAGFLEHKFKSLRPQPHWKPSEKQMDALDLASLDAYDDEDKETLKSLYNDLKKL